MSTRGQESLTTADRLRGVEAMHWTLDMDFDEDRSRARTEDVAENLAMLRHVVVNVLRLDKSLFGGISVKRKELTWDDDKLLKHFRRIKISFSSASAGRSKF